MSVVITDSLDDESVFEDFADKRDEDYGKLLKGGPTRRFPNTTTLVEIILNRIESGQVLHLVDHDLNKPLLPGTPTSTTHTGRAKLILGE
jgi:hypothetical protein